MIKEQEEYWWAQFSGEVPVLNLPLDYARPILQSSEGNVLTFELSAESTGALNQLRCVSKVYPSDTNFLLVEMNDAGIVYNELKKQKIIIRNRHALIKNCLRITVGTKDENDKLIKALKNL